MNYSESKLRNFEPTKVYFMEHTMFAPTLGYGYLIREVPDNFTEGTYYYVHETHTGNTISIPESDIFFSLEDYKKHAIEKRKQAFDQDVASIEALEEPNWEESPVRLGGDLI